MLTRRATCVLLVNTVVATAAFHPKPNFDLLAKLKGSTAIFKIQLSLNLKHNDHYVNGEDKETRL